MSLTTKVFARPVSMSAPNRKLYAFVLDAGKNAAYRRSAAPYASYIPTTA